MLYPSELQPQDFSVLVYPRESGFSRSSVCNSLTRSLPLKNMYFHDTSGEFCQPSVPTSSYPYNEKQG